MLSFVAAISSASTSGVNLAYAFFDPSGLHKSYQSSSLLPPTSGLKDIPDQRINLHAIHIIQLLQSLLDLPLVRLDITDENQRIVFLDFLHSAFRIQRVDDHFMVI